MNEVIAKNNPASKVVLVKFLSLQPLIVIPSLSEQQQHTNWLPLATPVPAVDVFVSQHGLPARIRKETFPCMLSAEPDGATSVIKAQAIVNASALGVFVDYGALLHLHPPSQEEFQPIPFSSLPQIPPFFPHDNIITIFIY